MNICVWQTWFIVACHVSPIPPRKRHLYHFPNFPNIKRCFVTKVDCEYTKDPEHNFKVCFYSFVVATPAGNWAIIEYKYTCVTVNIAYKNYVNF